MEHGYLSRANLEAGRPNVEMVEYREETGVHAWITTLDIVRWAASMANATDISADWDPLELPEKNQP